MLEGFLQDFPTEFWKFAAINFYE